ncbi:MAG: acetate--CoA ligase family protein [bacterium]
MPNSAQYPNLNPKSIAVVGASRDPKKIGSQILSNILVGKYKGKVFPVNPKAESIQSLKCYPNLTSITGEIDVAIIVLPAKIVPSILEECVLKKIQTVVIISAGFKEAGEEGKKLEEQITQIAEKGNIQLIGPNCLGFINTDINLNATFSAAPISKGNIVLFSQSGALATALLDWAHQSGLGFKHFVSLGNKANTNENILMEYWSQQNLDKNTLFAGYLEDFRYGRKFMELSSKVSKQFPIVILKPGKSSSATKAILSHTGSIATEDSIVDSALFQSGCVRVDTLEEFTNTINIISRQNLPTGNRTLIITNAGGPGVLTTDNIEQSSLSMSALSESSVAALKSKMPEASSISNPLDILGDADAKRYELAIEAAISDENVDGIIVLLTPQTSTEIEKTAEVIAKKYIDNPHKPIIACFIGGTLVEKAHEILNKNNVPVFRYPNDAVKALSWTYQAQVAKSQPDFIDQYKKTELTPQGTQNIVGNESEELAARYGIQITKSISISPDQDSVPDISSEIGFPVVAKIISPKLLHKTEVSGVITGLKNQEDLIDTVNNLKLAWSQVFPNDPNYCIQIQKQIMGGEDVILGMKNDPSFGPVLLFGAGGTLAELHKDTSQRICPISKEQILEMIKETRVYEALTGYRGADPRDIDSIVATLMNIQIITMENPDISEIDINPFIVLKEKEGGYAVDVKIIKNVYK